MKKKFWEEEERIIKKFNEEFEQYLRDVIDWLKDNDYLEDKDDEMVNINNDNLWYPMDSK